MDKELEPPHYKIRNIARRLEKELGVNVIHMEIGDPEVDTDPRIIEAMYRAALKGHTHYGSAKGIPILRESIAEYINEELNIDITSEDICIVPGSKSAIYVSLKTLSNGKARVAVIEPTWGVYYSFIRDLGHKAIPIKLRMENKWTLSDDDINKLSGSDFIVVINPSNPTGKVLERKYVKAIAEKASENNSIIIADEIYFNLIYAEKEFYTFFNTGYERIIGLYSFSKSFAMTGFRLGWVLSRNNTFIHKITKGYQMLLTNVPEFIQYAGVKALEIRDEVIEKNKSIYRDRTRYLSRELIKLGFKLLEPEATFYIFARIPEGFKDSIEFADKLLSQTYVAVAPGTAFGDYPEYVRFSAALKEDKLKEAVKRMRNFLA